MRVPLAKHTLIALLVVRYGSLGESRRTQGQQTKSISNQLAAERKLGPGAKHPEGKVENQGQNQTPDDRDMQMQENIECIQDPDEYQQVYDKILVHGLRLLRRSRYPAWADLQTISGFAIFVKNTLCSRISEPCLLEPRDLGVPYQEPHVRELVRPKQPQLKQLFSSMFSSSGMPVTNDQFCQNSRSWSRSASHIMKLFEQEI